MSLTDFYKGLVTTQYWDKPNAKDEIGAMVAGWEEIYEFLSSWTDAFDLDQAQDHRLDIIGKVVGLPREVPFSAFKTRFGFETNSNARGFGNKFDPFWESAPLFDRFEAQYTSTQLDNYAYRFFLRAKIAVNVSAAYMASGERISIQDAIQTAFDGLAFVLDNEDMSMTLYVSPQVPLDTLLLVDSLKLLPKPQGVKYNIIVQAEPLKTFGFASNPNALGMGDKFNSAVQGGFFARKIIL